MLWLRILDFGLWEVSLEPPSGCYDVGQRGVVGFKSIVLENTLVLVNVYICSKLRLASKLKDLPTYDEMIAHKRSSSQDGVSKVSIG